MDRLPTEALDSAMQLAAFQIIRRNGAVVAFDPNKIAVAMTKAFLAVEGRQGAASSRVRDIVARLTDTVVGALTRRLPDGGMLHIEDIQDQVELALMRSGEHDVARAYVLYRERRAAERAAQKDAEAQAGGAGPVLHVVDGEARRPLDRAARSTAPPCSPCAARPARGWTVCPPTPCSNTPCTTSTTACRLPPCARRWCWPHAR